ncbi:expressed unknown protein [Seminavis robusta]|uniref:Uncharacterized protein n=1 Tax=Seminavis robusta TaxID=568900 RepID=A0A9N8H4P2_9STRA|nr:expressed unknown protein [Seminavis robusta]|eukprot:Sro89_g047160.1 n/a (270) ;mRNA; r:119891-120700
MLHHKNISENNRNQKERAITQTQQSAHANDDDKYSTMMRNKERIVTLWKERQRRKAPRQQGTEVQALKQLERNRSSIGYPKEGFEVKIEFSLLYAMLSAPDTYPAEVVHAMVDEEDFTQYMTTKDGATSYAQLSAILAYAAETNPPEDAKEELSVSQKLCKKILQTVVRYAEANELDRETEIDELLTPVKKVARERIERKELAAILPLYLGYSAALLTANPLPLLVGAMGLAAAPGSAQEMQNMDKIMNETERKTDIERTGLLDEGEDF